MTLTPAQTMNLGVDWVILKVDVRLNCIGKAAQKKGRIAVVGLLCVASTGHKTTQEV